MKELEQMPDTEIKFTDVPEVRRNTFSNKSGIAPLFKPIKQQITLRLDSDIIAWAKSGGAGYQSRINAALRDMLTMKKKSSSRSR